MIRWLLPRRGRDPALQFEGVAAVVERLAALVRAGATPSAAWGYIAASTADESVRVLARAVAEAAARGAPIDHAFRAAALGDAGQAWRRIGAAVVLAAEVGAPLGGVLERSARGLRDAADLHRRIAASVAGPAASTRVTLLLPPGAAVLGWAFGFDVPGVLFGSLGGAALLAVGAALLLGARAWSRRLVAAAARVPWEQGLGLELVAVGLRGGLAVDRAEAYADLAAGGVGIDLSGDRAALADAIEFATDAGIPLVALLDAEADRRRRAVLAKATADAEALAARLLLPLGALVLPAFLLLGAAPIGIAVLSSTATPF